MINKSFLTVEMLVATYKKNLPYILNLMINTKGANAYLLLSYDDNFIIQEPSFYKLSLNILRQFAIHALRQEVFENYTKIPHLLEARREQLDNYFIEFNQDQILEYGDCQVRNSQNPKIRYEELLDNGIGTASVNAELKLAYIERTTLSDYIEMELPLVTTTTKVVTSKDIYVRADNIIVKELEKINPSDSIPSYLDQTNPNYSPLLAGSVYTWIDIFGDKTTKVNPMFGVIPKAKKILASYCKDESPTSISKAATTLNPGHNKNNKTDK